MTGFFIIGCILMGMALIAIMTLYLNSGKINKEDKGMLFLMFCFGGFLFGFFYPQSENSKNIKVVYNKAYINITVKNDTADITKVVDSIENVKIEKCKQQALKFLESLKKDNVRDSIKNTKILKHENKNSN